MALTSQVKASVALDNLVAQQKELSNLSQIRLSYLDDMAHVAEDYVLSLIKDELPFGVILSKLSERCREVGGVSVSTNSGITADDRYLICKLLSKRLLHSAPAFALSIFPEENCGNKIAFVRSEKADELISFLENESIYESLISVNDFDEAIACVINGEADYCLLPCALHAQFPITRLFDEIFKTDLLLCTYIQTDHADFGLYGKKMRNIPDRVALLQFGFPLEKYDSDVVDLPISRHVNSRFVYRQSDERAFQIDAFRIREIEEIYAILFYCKIFYPTAKLLGCADFAQL